MHLGVVQSFRSFSRFNDFYPLLRWKKSLLRDGFEVTFVNYTQPWDRFDCVLLHTRQRVSGYPSRQQLIKRLQNNRNNIPIVLFDGYDTTGFIDSDLAPFASVILKKQLLCDLREYLVNRGDKSVRCWLSSESEPSQYPNYSPIDAADLNKLRVGWNIALNDFCEYGFKSLNIVKNFWPFRILSSRRKFATKSTDNRKFFCTYRGTVQQNSAISEQRNAIIKTLNALSRDDMFASENRLKRSRFLKELANSKVGISPFGWGELCYRDFEILLMKALLIKPDVSHLTTFPNVFLPMETYVPVKWDMTDLPARLSDVDSHWSDYVPIVERGHSLLVHYQSSYIEFKNHLFTALASVFP